MGYIRDVRLTIKEMVPMRDGVQLATTIFLPVAEGIYPVVLVRTAYNRVGFNGADFARQGIAMVIQDCRGRYDSEGDHYPFVTETEDGLDTLDWITAQPWCNGRIGMFGDSYLAGTQLAIAASNHPSVVALNPRFMCGDPWRHAYYNDGVFSLALCFSWLCLEVGSRTSAAALLPHYDIGALLSELPLLTLDEKVGSGAVRYYRDYITHDTRDAFWQDLDWRHAMPRATAPHLHIGGWYDYYAGEAFLNYLALCENPDPAVRAGHRVIIGPWTHGVNGTTRLGQLDYGTAALAENDATVRWLECVLKGGTPAQFQTAPIRLFVMGLNQWRDENEWPLARTQWTKYYLHSGGSANSMLGDGDLSTEAPHDEPADRYDYNPENPVPTLGGNHSVGPYNPGLYDICLPGPYDQRPIERRDDVLCYTTAALEEDVEVTGPVVMHLFAASSAPDTDFVARLCDVYPDGRSINITEGVLRARFRAREWDRTELMTPDEVYEFVIDMQATSNVFFKGHRIRIDITSSNFPLWDRNLNTGAPLALGETWQVAEQTVRHDGEFASYVVLPVVGVSS